MQIVPCKTYHAKAVGQTLLRMPDGKSAFKLYYVSIIGRDKPELYEWERAPLAREEFEKRLSARGFEGLGFIIAFPHVTKVFRFSPFVEIVIDVLEFKTADLSRLDCQRKDGWHEFACYAEAVIAAEEYVAWARAATVEGYLAFRCAAVNYPILSNTKLASHWNCA